MESKILQRAADPNPLDEAMCAIVQHGRNGYLKPVKDLDGLLIATCMQLATALDIESVALAPFSGQQNAHDEKDSSGQGRVCFNQMVAVGLDPRHFTQVSEEKLNQALATAATALYRIFQLPLPVGV